MTDETDEKAIDYDHRLAGLANGMILEFGERAAEVARVEEDKASDEAAASWEAVVYLINRRLTARQYHRERRDHALQMAADATDATVRRLHVELADLHAKKALEA